MVVTATVNRGCLVCGIDISDRRRQATFCSTRCRGMHHRGEPYLPAAACEVCRAKLDGFRGDARYCSAKCRTRAWRVRHERLGVTPTNGFLRSAGVIPFEGDPGACTRCVSSVAYRDEDGRCCFMCGRLREAA